VSTGVQRAAHPPPYGPAARPDLVRHSQRLCLSIGHGWVVQRVTEIPRGPVSRASDRCYAVEAALLAPYATDQLKRREHGKDEENGRRPSGRRVETASRAVSSTEARAAAG